MLQEDKAADFINNIFSQVSVYSDADTDPSASNIGRELSLGRISVVLPVDILLKKLARCLKTNIKKRVALSYCIYTFINKEKGYL